MDPRLPLPALGLSDDEVQRRFERLQSRLVPLWESISSLEDTHEQTIVVVPSITVEFDLLGSEAQAYEERFLFLLPSRRQVMVIRRDCSSSSILFFE